MGKLCKLILLFVVFLPTVAFAQNKLLIDSLQQAITRQDDSSKVWTLTNLSWQWRQYDRNKALHYAQEAINLARSRNDPEQIGFCWMATGNVYSYHKNTAEALTAYQKAEGYFGRNSNSRRDARLAQLQINKGLIYRDQLNDSIKAMDAYLKAARFYEKIKDWSHLSECYTNIGNLLASQKADEQAVVYFEKALTFARRSLDPEQQAGVYNDFYSGYIDRYRRQPDPEFLKKAISGFQEAIALCRQYPNEIPAQYLPTLLSNLGECYLLQKKPDLARQMLQEALRLAKPIHYDQYIGPNNYALLAEIDFGQGKNQAAQNNMVEAECHYDALDWSSQLTIAGQLAKVNAEQKRWPDAFRWQKRYQAATDSLGHQERNRAIASLNVRYDVEKKDAQIDSLTQETANQRKLMGLAIGLALALLVLAWVGFRLWRVQQQLNSVQKKDFDVKIGQKERTLTMHALSLTTKSALLSDLRNVLQGHPESKAALRLIDQNAQVDEEVDTFRRHFEAVYPQFFQNLQAHAQQPLSSIDLRYCAYLYMGLTTKEIANLLNIDPASIRVAKYRLKQKLNLSKEIDLDDFLKKA